MLSKKVLSRRDFLKLSAGSTAALGLLLLRFPNFERLIAEAVAEVPVIWLQGSGCTGCSVTILNSLSPKIQDLLLSQVVPNKHVSVRYHPTIMASQGEQALKALEDTASMKKGYVLVIEGSIPTKDNGIYCEIAEKDEHGITMLEETKRLGADAMAVIAIGACSAFGGIPAAVPNVTGCKPVKTIFDESGIRTPLINLPGCPPHPDWFVGTVATILIGGLEAVKLDDKQRPVAFYSKLIHDNCPRRGHFDNGLFAKKYGEPYCLFELGCKGPVTYADCPVRLWNSGTNWCVGSNSPCIGCASPDFPDKLSPLKSVPPIYTVTPPSWLPPIKEEKAVFPPEIAAGLGAIGGAAIGAAGVALARKAKKSDGTEKKPEE